jgi:hypothetical protein
MYSQVGQMHLQTNPLSRQSKDQKLQRSLEARGRELEDRTKLIELLLSLPEAESFQLLQRLRSASNLSSLTSSIKGSLDTSRHSDLATARAIPPATRSTVEFELSAQFTTVFPKMISKPIDGAIHLLPARPDSQSP